jgi:hypothetical protein
MKKNEVKVGTVYRVKVSGSIQDVRIIGENPHGGWDGVNVATKRKVHIKSAQRLRSVAGERPAKRKKIVSLAEYEAQAKGEKKDQPKEDVAATVPAAAKKKRGGITEATKAKAVDAAMHAVAADKKKRASGLDAAAQVLAEAKEPLNTREMVDRMLAKGLWKTNGRTPSATIYAAILRECQTKGEKARFRKVERGKFELVK